MDLSDKITSRKVMLMPTRDKGERLARKLGKVRDHKYKWPAPIGAELVLSLHFNVHSFRSGLYHAEATLEIPTDNGWVYASVTADAKTHYDALIALIEKIQGSMWFHYMKSRGVYFKITGDMMEKLYRGYL